MELVLKNGMIEDSWSEEKLEGGFLNEEGINNRCRAGGIDSSI